MEKPVHYHEVIRPMGEVGRAIIDFALEKLVPTRQAVEEAFNPDLPETGGGPALDRALYDQPEIPENIELGME